MNRQPMRTEAVNDAHTHTHTHVREIKFQQTSLIDALLQTVPRVALASIHQPRFRPEALPSELTRSAGTCSSSAHPAALEVLNRRVKSLDIF